jgi:AraC family ethanolamine operon transcriptional activator
MNRHGDWLACEATPAYGARSFEATAAFSVRHVNTYDADDQAANLGHWEQAYEQLTAGRFEGHLIEVWLDGVQVFRETTCQSVHQVGRAWSGSCAFGIPLVMASPATFRGCVMGPHSLLTLRAEGELDFRTPVGLDIVGIAVPVEELACLAAQDELDIETLLKTADVVECSSAHYWALRRGMLGFFSRLEALVASLRAHAGARRALREALVAQLCAVLAAARADDPPPIRLALRRQLVDRAKAMALEDTGIPVTVAGLCRALRVSRRTLQYCFRETLGLSPASYLRAVRLNGARRQLKSPDSPVASVQEAAARWGFWHLGHFSSDYKRMFGELPSATLRQRSDV